MTVFVVNLFLPYTISFDDDEDEVPQASTASATFSSQSSQSFSERGSKEEIADDYLMASANHAESFKTKPLAPIREDEESSFIESSDTMVPTEFGTLPWGESVHFTQPSARPRAPIKSSLSDFKVSAKPDPKQGNRKVSNLLPHELDDDVTNTVERRWRIGLAEHGNGPLRNAVFASKRNGVLPDMKWIGTMSMPTDSVVQETLSAITKRLDELSCATVIVDDEVFAGHYTHFCRQVLWPILHYQIPDSPRDKVYEDTSWKDYVQINQSFADKIIEQWKEGDTIWIHDYHLMLVPNMVRQKIPEASIGFFLHSTFPSSEVFRCLAPRRQLLLGVLGADLVGFQTLSDSKNFRRTCRRILSLNVDRGEIHLPGKTVRIQHFPVGIDCQLLCNVLRSPQVESWKKKLSEEFDGKSVVVARDRVDRVSGIKQKLLSFERFLDRYPKWKNKVVLAQIMLSAAPAASSSLNAEISDIVTRINKSHANLTYQPLIMLNQDLDHHQFLALLSIADVCMITSLRDGMNLTSHDFIFCQVAQKNAIKHGSLILSEFAGSASNFGEHALIVNPWDYDGCAEALETALSFSDAERQERLGALEYVVRSHDSKFWCHEYLDALASSRATVVSHEHASQPPLKPLAEDYNVSQNRLLILSHEAMLDLDVQKPLKVFDSLVLLIRRLLNDPRNVIYVASSFPFEQVERDFQELPKLGLIAENGYKVKKFRTQEWCILDDGDPADIWMPSVAAVLHYYNQRTPKSSVLRGCRSFLFSFVNALGDSFSQRQASCLLDELVGCCGSEILRISLANGYVSVTPSSHDRVTAAEHILEHMGEGVDFALLVGGWENEALLHWADTENLGSVHTFFIDTTPHDYGDVGVISPQAREVENILRCLITSSTDSCPA